MKKSLIFIVLLTKVGVTKGQQWITKKCDSTAWVHVDTLNKYSDSSGWVYSEWFQVPYSIPDSAHRYWRKEMQRRYGKTSGWLMERSRVTEFIFIPKTKTEYERVMDSVSK